MRGVGAAGARRHYVDDGWHVLGLNNAWKVPFPHLDEWIHASDYSLMGTLFPKDHQWSCIRCIPAKPQNCARRVDGSRSSCLS